ncbi:sulfate adenylyltransferase subunit CysD [Geomonas propionica]|uniref:Sulfate adenylyltransferase subunit 2 n=1 Tax=Geomonas propionica TaxID=2798582 RepID=A0ABS0YWU7_9BACT|nr:sulfate adenylyltransferase subunit CysD [Geomonas propionica]MBJ6801950.1 sulfate adenylyltransferase subunit 2 [Geomonas propionica]
MDYYQALESKSVYVIREAYQKFNGRIAMLWSVGKDSTTLLWLVRKAFFGEIPFPVIHIDTSYKFPEMYEFRDRLAKEWGFELIVASNDHQLAQGMGPSTGMKLDCCTELKTNALKQVVERHGFQSILLGIRRDEHGIRAKERYFSPRDAEFQWDYENQPAEVWDQYNSFLREDEHYRIHPILHFTELDIWRYVQRENIPIVDLYRSNNGARYRSIGCVPCCSPVPSQASTVAEIIAELETSTQSERAGRAQDKENLYTMQKLRSLGYM